MNFLPVDTTLDGDVTCPADSVVGIPPGSGLQGQECFDGELSAIPAEPSPPDSLTYRSDDDRTASWVQDVSPAPVVGDAGLFNDPETSSLGTGLLATAGASPHFSDTPDPVHPPDNMTGDIAGRLTSRFGRVIKPVCHLIENMAIIEALYKG